MRHEQACLNQPFEGPSTGTSLAEGAHRPTYSFPGGARPTFAGTHWTAGTVLWELMSGLLPRGPPWEGTGGARGNSGISRLASFVLHALAYGFRYIRQSVLHIGQTAVLPFCCN